MRTRHGKKRQYKTLKDYKAHCRSQTINGYVNRADGTWTDKNKVGNTDCSDHKFNCVQKGTLGKKSKYGG